MQEVKKHGIYRHFKGDYYLVEDIVNHSETKERLVLYRALYGEGQLWVRPYEMFTGEVDRTKYPGIRQRYRFELQERYADPEQARRQIVIAGSAKFWRESLEHKTILENAGFEVLDYTKQETTDKSWRSLYEYFWSKLFRADDIFVLNLDKKGVKGYIGAETFAELSFMAVRKMRGDDVRIYLYQWPSKKCTCYDEIMEMKELDWLELWSER